MYADIFILVIELITNSTLHWLVHSRIYFNADLIFKLVPVMRSDGLKYQVSAK